MKTNNGDSNYEQYEMDPALYMHMQIRGPIYKKNLRKILSLS